ncbi:hypothetical protein EDD18DRAFT_1349514 [Armillaria luteobubalina]|uniref:rRNA methyltransferase 2, mitochondrial n=1 Tax=Armillaria luteobubalina TaxID=153913 RepID=A0AA39QBM9_9AGAR|nr:hypothetical protein EDD18DRAFT_1349514 [Armillaria luteobubalina]
MNSLHLHWCKHWCYYIKQQASSVYKSHSAFKLLRLDKQLSFLNNNDVHIIVDLGAVPGRWSQVVWQHLGHGSTKDSEPLPSTLPQVRSQCRPTESCPGSDYDPLNIDNMEEELVHSESKGTWTLQHEGRWNRKVNDPRLDQR